MNKLTKILGTASLWFLALGTLTVLFGFLITMLSGLQLFVLLGYSLYQGYSYENNKKENNNVHT